MERMGLGRSTSPSKTDVSPALTPKKNLQPIYQLGLLWKKKLRGAGIISNLNRLSDRELSLSRLRA